MNRIRPIAIHLPQFHPIPENDAWWGKGFTEWTNVARATPLFQGHYQPHIPSDLGFYDLRLAEARKAQADLAAEYGIYGFCYYHYWFNGRRILERPVKEILASGEPGFPFMLCWANENWTRVWDGGDKDVLLEQVYSEQDDINHIRELLPYFKDPRYIRIDGKPVFAVYKSGLFPDIQRTLSTWRREAAAEGMELYLCRFERSGNEGEALMAGFDAAIEFQPQDQKKPVNTIRTLKDEVTLRTIYNSIIFRARRLLLPGRKNFPGQKLPGWVASYEAYVDTAMNSHEEVNYKRFPGVSPGWDNSSRRKTGFAILHGSTPQLFGKWLRSVLARFKPYSLEENLVFINAWNEWAEGNHLEPCQKWGRQYLEEVKQSLREFDNNPC